MRMVLKYRKVSPLLVAFFIALFAPHSFGANGDDTNKTYSSVEERRLENTIFNERTVFKKEREEILLRKKELKVLEEGVDKKLAELDNKMEELKVMRTRIESLLSEKSVEEKKRVASLAKIYEKMNPAKAALALSGLEKQLASDLLDNMKVKAAAKILDQISKQKVTELSTTYSTLQLE